jgi:hypothetical protein
MRTTVVSLCLSLAMLGAIPHAPETPPNGVAEVQAEQALGAVEAQKGGANADELKHMVEAITALKGKVSVNTLNRYTERATAAIAASITAAEHHGTRAFGAKQASQLLREKGLIAPEVAEGLERLADSVRRPTNSADTSHFKRNWAEGQSREFLKKAGPSLRYENLKPVSSTADPEAKKFEQEVDKLHADVVAAKTAAKPQLPPDALQRLKRIGEKAKEVKNRIDDLKTKNAPAAKKAADDWAPGLVKAGTVGAEVYSLVKDWNNKSDLENVRDSLKALGSVLGAIQLALSAAVPEKLLVVAILGILAEILDLGIAFFDGDGPKGNKGGGAKPPSDGSGDSKGKEGGQGGGVGEPKKSGENGGGGGEQKPNDPKGKNGSGNKPDQQNPGAAGGGIPFDRKEPKGELPSVSADPKAGESGKPMPRDGAKNTEGKPQNANNIQDHRKALGDGTQKAIDNVKEAPSPSAIEGVKKQISEQVAQTKVLKNPEKWVPKIADAVAKALEQNRYSDPERLRKIANDAASAVIQTIPESDFLERK